MPEEMPPRNKRESEREREREGEGEFIKLFEMGFRFRVVQQPCPPETPGASRVSLCSANTSHLALGTWHKLRVQRGKVRRAEAGLGRAEANDWMQLPAVGSGRGQPR